MFSVEDIGHLLASYPQMWSRFYLPLKHNELVKTFLYSQKRSLVRKKLYVMRQNICTMKKV